MRFYTRPVELPATARVALVKTAWGFAAIASRQQRLVRLFLPQEKERNLWRGVAKAYPGYERDDDVCLEFQCYLRDYFLEKVARPKGQVDISWASDFEQAVLKTCSKIRPARTVTYGQLAQRAGYPRAARAVGSVMAKNPLPLLIPCHRIIGANGAMRGYSGFGGIDMKQRLLEHEQAFA